MLNSSSCTHLWNNLSLKLIFFLFNPPPSPFLYLYLLRIFMQFTHSPIAKYKIKKNQFKLFPIFFFFCSLWLQVWFQNRRTKWRKKHAAEMATAKRKQEVLDNQTDENSDVISDTEEEHIAKRQNIQWTRLTCKYISKSWNYCKYGLVISVFVGDLVQVWQLDTKKDFIYLPAL